MKTTCVFKKELTVSTGNIKVELVYNVPTDIGKIIINYIFIYIYFIKLKIIFSNRL